MAESNTVAPEESPAVESPASPKAGGMLVKVTALLFVVAVILAECIVAYLYLPTSSEANAAASESDKVESGKKEKEHGKRHKEGETSKKEHSKKKEKEKEAGPKPEETMADENDLAEVDLEQFQVTAHQPTAATTMRIEFHLYGAVAAQDMEEFERLIKASQHRFREQVLMIVRSAQGIDLADAGLGLIKRQILEKTNALLGKPLLRAVVVSDFSYIEQ